MHSAGAYILYTDTISYLESQTDNIGQGPNCIVKPMQLRFGPGQVSQSNMASTREILSSGVCEKQRGTDHNALQSSQRLYYSLIGKYHTKTCTKRNFTILSLACLCS